MGRTYVVRKHTVGPEGQYTSYTIGIPAWMGRVLPEGIELLPELTPEGILFRPVSVRNPQDVPDWVSQ
jgi:hypothetical protein